MFIALRRFTLITTMLLERLMYKRKHDRSTYGAVGTMILGEFWMEHYVQLCNAVAIHSVQMTPSRMLRQEPCWQPSQTCRSTCGGTQQ